MSYERSSEWAVEIARRNNELDRQQEAEWRRERAARRRADRQRRRAR